MTSINTVEKDLRDDFQVELKEVKVQILKISSNQAELMKEQQRQIHYQQHHIEVLQQELFNVKSLLMETNCTQVKECVAEDLTHIDHKLIADDIKILQNEAAINQVTIAYNHLIKAMQELFRWLSMFLYFAIIDRGH